MPTKVELERRVKDLEKDVYTIVNMTHQAYHPEGRGGWRECPVASCNRARAALGVEPVEVEITPANCRYCGVGLDPAFCGLDATICDGCYEERQ